MTVTLDLPPDLADTLNQMPTEERNRFAVAALREKIAAPRFPEQEHPGRLSPRQLLALSPAQRERLFREGAEKAKAMYEADLALPSEERELTAFTALNDDPVLEPEEYLSHAR